MDGLPPFIALVVTDIPPELQLAHRTFHYAVLAVIFGKLSEASMNWGHMRVVERGVLNATPNDIYGTPGKPPVNLIFVRGTFLPYHPKPDF